MSLSNVGVNGIRKYLRDDGPIKGAPWHVKGVWNYRFLLKELGLEHIYENIKEGAKSRVVYVKENKYGILLFIILFVIFAIINNI